MGVDQISQFRQTFTISAKFHNPGIPGILGIPGVRTVSQFLRCFNVIHDVHLIHLIAKKKHIGKPILPELFRKNILQG